MADQEALVKNSNQTIAAIASKKLEALEEKYNVFDKEYRAANARLNYGYEVEKDGNTINMEGLKTQLDVLRQRNSQTAFNTTKIDAIRTKLDLNTRLLRLISEQQRYRKQVSERYGVTLETSPLLTADDKKKMSQISSDVVLAMAELRTDIIMSGVEPRSATMTDADYAKAIDERVKGILDRYTLDETRKGIEMLSSQQSGMPASALTPKQKAELSELNRIIAEIYQSRGTPESATATQETLMGAVGKPDLSASARVLRGMAASQSTDMNELAAALAELGMDTDSADIGIVLASIQGQIQKVAGDAKMAEAAAAPATGQPVAVSSDDKPATPLNAAMKAAVALFTGGYGKGEESGLPTAGGTGRNRDNGTGVA